MGDELVEEPFRERPAADAREDVLDESPPEAALAVGLAPADLPQPLPLGDVAPRGAERRADLGVADIEAPAPEGGAVGLLDRRFGGEERVPRVEEDRLRPLQGITCPPSMTIDCPVTFRESSPASQATRPATSSGTRTSPSGAIRAAARKACSSFIPIALP